MMQHDSKGSSLRQALTLTHMHLIYPHMDGTADMNLGMLSSVAGLTLVPRHLACRCSAALRLPMELVYLSSWPT